MNSKLNIVKFWFASNPSRMRAVTAGAILVLSLIGTIVSAGGASGGSH
ncbi:MAG: hypothetical protein H7175_05275 [Burkholderiales bacterium]|nr:hypothetical protein [Anaerolineae bacterium]